MARQSSQQPQPSIQQPGAADPQYGPAPAEQNVPYEHQPVNQQYFAQPQAAPVQYVVMAQSLKGVKGWLAFFMVCLAIDGVCSVGLFFYLVVKPRRSIGCRFGDIHADYCCTDYCRGGAH